jgi:hypothetical protein
MRAVGKRKLERHNGYFVSARALLVAVQPTTHQRACVRACGRAGATPRSKAQQTAVWPITEQLVSIAPLLHHDIMHFTACAPASPPDARGHSKLCVSTFQITLSKTSNSLFISLSRRNSVVGLELDREDGRRVKLPSEDLDVGRAALGRQPHHARVNGKDNVLEHAVELVLFKQ